MGNSLNHKERAHALLSASGAERWMACTPSARLEDELPEEPETFFTLEGTLAHELAELELRLATDQVSEADYQAAYEQITASEYYSDEMDDYVDTYVQFVLDEYRQVKRHDPDGLLKIEDRIDLTEYIEDGFGTNDAVIVGGRTLIVADLKYGKGVPVSAEDNPQLKLYGLGALYANELLYQIDTVRLAIVQPRLDSISTWEIPAPDLLAWGEKVVRPTARMAYDGLGELTPGDHCRWCRAKAQCPALAEHNLALAKHEFAKPELMDDEAVLQVYEQLDRLTEWAKAVGEYVLSSALDGKHWPGYKLVEGRSRRKWADEEGAIAALRKQGLSDEQILKMNLEGITKIEKLVGKKSFSEIVGPYVVKAPGKPTLVPISDKRPALGLEQAKEDFS